MEQSFECAARALIGAPFRLHGRDPETGLDCVGVVAQALRSTGRQTFVPEGYSLRSASISGLLHFAAENALTRVEQGGHVVLCMVNPIQPHLLVRVSGGFVHAHASLGRVTFMPDPLPWPISLQWKLEVPLQDRKY